eukprot:TRINITY_DN45273_c0_g1_i1.p1 TRINITY_DN45273_c0_g1~~TRINITY_DN45273_c0_g1_i1.p1  ORF type:complete len:301 (-),score=47.98 TRINITY_DN45273_c0_g1_i1:64-894(-)
MAAMEVDGRELIPRTNGPAAEPTPTPTEVRRKSSHKVDPNEFYINRNGIEAIQGQIRADFIRKVYGILAFQMAITIAICAAGMYIPRVQQMFLALAVFKSNTGLLGTILFLVPALGLVCALHAKKTQHPTNYFLLTAFTVVMSIDVGIVCARFAAAGLGVLVLEAFSLTMFVFLALSLYALISGRDFSWMGGMLFMALAGMIMVGFLGAIFGFDGGILMPIFGVIVFSGYILYDTHRLLQIFGPDDAVVAAVELYLDILNLFLQILEILARASPRN